MNKKSGTSKDAAKGLAKAKSPPTSERTPEIAHQIQSFIVNFPFIVCFP